MKNFTQCDSVKKLKELAKNPIDLTLPQNLSSSRIKSFCASACGYKLIYGMEKVTEEVIKALFDLADEMDALKKMQAMQSGQVVNFIKGHQSENRSALHTATRDFFSQPISTESAKEATKLAKKEIDKLKEFIRKIDEENRFTDLVMIGIGGSDLGPRAHFMALKYLLKPGRKIHFMANVDPDDAQDTLKSIDLKKTIVLIVSKTGTTLETETNENWIRDHFQNEGLDPRHHMVSITMPGSPMDDSEKYLACFHIWEWVGGRYSTTSMVGGVLLSFAFGFEIFWEMLEGANAMDKQALNKDYTQNLPLLAALLGIWNRNFLNYSTLAIIPYSQALIRFPAHIQQLDMESNGKHVLQNGDFVSFDTGPIIWGEIGTNAQHSFFQLLHQGTTIVPIEFIGFRESQQQEDFVFKKTTSQQKLLSNLIAQSIALATGQYSENPNKDFAGNRPSHIILGERLTPYALGALLAFYEHKTAFQGFIWGINSFDQEGVQLGKTIANQILEKFAHHIHKENLIVDAMLEHLKTF